MKRWASFGLGVWGVLLVCISARGASTYHLTDLGDLRGGGVESSGWGINNFGQVVGRSYGSFVDQRAFLWTPTTPNGTTGSMVNLGDLPGGDPFSEGYGINASGQIAGYSSGTNGYHAFLWTPTTPHATTGTMTDLGDLPNGANQSRGFAINDVGQVAGLGEASTGTHAFLWTPAAPNGNSGSITDLGDLPGGTDDSTAHGINNYGQVVGLTDTNLGYRGFLWTPNTANGSTGSMIDLGDLPTGTTTSSGWAINDYGKSTGYSTVEGGTHGYLWSPTSPNGTTGSMQSLGDFAGGPVNSLSYGINAYGHVVGYGFDSIGPRASLWTSTDGLVDLNTRLDASGAGWTLTWGLDINDFGQITGQGTIGGVNHAFLLTPVVPEPAITAIACVGLLFIRRRRS